MTLTRTLPMTGAAAIGPIPRLLAEMAGDREIERVFGQAGLCQSVLEAPRSPIPLEALTRLWESGARATGERCFGFSGGFEMTHKTYGLWLEFCISGSTLGDALSRIPQSLRFHQTGTRFSFTRDDTVGVLRYHPAWPGQYPQHSDHVVGSALRLIRGFLGQAWHPSWVELDYARDPGWKALEYAIEAPLHFEATTTGVAVPLADLACPNPRENRPMLVLEDVAAEASVAVLPEPLQTASNVVAYRLLEGRTDIDGAAAQIGIGVQSLQRRLRLSGTTYRNLVSLARRNRAEALLRTTDRPISEIAFALGYEDHANFTHAFGKWTGRSPSEFRRDGGRDLRTTGFYGCRPWCKSF